MKTGKISLALSIFVLISFLTAPIFAFTADSVLSHDIKDADGTSGQNTGTGSGVKTGHIQESAVTTGKIADGAVTTQKIADGAVTDAKIGGPISGSKLGSHLHSGADLSDGTITGSKMAPASISTDKIQDNAVTDAKIAGPISASKISSAGLNADTVDGMHASDLAPSVHIHSQSQVTGLEAALAGKSEVTHNHDTLYQQKYGKTAVVAQTGGDYTDPVTAMNNIGVWCGAPSAANPCLLKIMPGNYNIGSGALQMLSYVDIEGAGENTTVIAGTGNLTSTQPAVVLGSSNAELRFLTVENVGGGGQWSTAMTNSSANSLKLSHVTLKSSGESLYGHVGMYNNHSTLSTVDVTVTVSGNGANEGISNSFTSFVANNVSVTVTGNSDVIGLFSSGGAQTLNDVNVRINGGGSHGYALWNGGSVTCTLSNSDIAAVGGRYGVLNQDSSLIITNSTVSGDEYGVLNQALPWGGPAPSLRISHSTIKGGTSINNAGAQVYIGVSELNGSISAAPGTLSCSGVYDANFASIVCP